MQCFFLHGLPRKEHNAEEGGRKLNLMRTLFVTAPAQLNFSEMVNRQRELKNGRDLGAGGGKEQIQR